MWVYSRCGCGCVGVGLSVGLSVGVGGRRCGSGGGGWKYPGIPRADPFVCYWGGVFTTFFAVTFPKLVREALKAILFLTSFCIRCFNFQSEAGFFFPQGATGERRGFHGRAGFPEVTYVPHHCG